MASTCNWMIKIVKVYKLYLNGLAREYCLPVCLEAEQGNIYASENTDVSNKKWLLT